MINAIFAHHLYDYCVVDRAFNIVSYSEHAEAYFDPACFEKEEINLLEAVPEFVGLEDALQTLFQNQSDGLHLPTVFKAPDQYITIRVEQSKDHQVLIVLFENITDATIAKQSVVQANNENLLLLKEIEEKNRQLEAYNHEMEKLVKAEVAKNLDKQHMLELQTRHAQMGEMIAMITHQWKQPLSVIQTISTQIKLKSKLQKISSGFLIEKVNTLLEQTRYMTDTVLDFQKFFTPSKSKARFNIKETIQSLLHLVKTDYIHTNIMLTIEGDEEVWVEGYPNEYNQVILSILHNAKDALLIEPFDEMEIIINVKEEHGYSLVTIEDNAGGVDVTLFNTIFNQYVTSKKKGSGLGLYIAKSVIEKNMGGKIWVENSNKGAIFYIKL